MKNDSFEVEYFSFFRCVASNTFRYNQFARNVGFATYKIENPIYSKHACTAFLCDTIQTTLKNTSIHKVDGLYKKMGGK